MLSVRQGMDEYDLADQMTDDPATESETGRPPVLGTSCGTLFYIPPAEDCAATDSRMIIAPNVRCSRMAMPTSITSTIPRLTKGGTSATITTPAVESTESIRTNRMRPVARQIATAVPQMNNASPKASAVRKLITRGMSGRATDASMATANAMMPHNMGKCTILKISRARHDRARPSRTSIARSNAGFTYGK